MKKLSSKKGFTLMEMLIVVAIIAVLVAIMIPTLSGSTAKAKEAADIANIRSLFAQAQASALTNNGTVSISWSSPTLTMNVTPSGGSESSVGNVKLSLPDNFEQGSTTNEWTYTATNNAQSYTLNLSTGTFSTNS